MRTRRRHLAGRASGRILDLGGAASHRSLWSTGAGVTRLDGASDPALSALAREDERFDTVLSVFQLVSAADLAATLYLLRTLLAEDGRLLFLEPGRLAGLAGRTQRVLAPAMAITTGWHVDRDVPMELRQAGLSVTELERHRAATTQWWLRSLVEGTARRALVTPRR